MKYKIKNIDMLFRTTILGSFIFIEFFNYLYSSDFLLSIYILVVCLINVIAVRKNKYLFILFFFMLYANYSICLPNYICYFTGDFFVSWTPSNVSSIGLNILATFSTLLYLFLPKINITKRDTFITEKKNGYISFGLLIMLLIVLLISLPNLLVDGRGQTTAIYEYSVILFIIGLYYSGKSQITHICYFIVASIYILIDLMSGNRATSIQICIVIYLIFFIDKISTKQLLIFMILGLFLFSMVGAYRENTNVVSITKFFNKINERKLVFDTAYAAYYTSLTFIKAATGVSLYNKILMFLAFVFYIFTGIGIGDYSLPVFTRKFYVHYFGGVYPFYGYFYFGCLGIFIFLIYLLFIIRLINKVNTNSSGFSKCFSILVVSSVPRWYLYSPFQITRNIFLLWIIWNVLKLLDNLIENRNKLNIKG